VCDCLDTPFVGLLHTDSMSVSAAGRRDDVLEASIRLFRYADFILAVVFLSPEAGSPPLGLSPAEFYVASRAAPLGPLPGRVIAAVFGAIRPAAVVAATETARSRTEPQELLEARLAMALTVLERELHGTDGIERAVTLLRRAGEAGPIEGHPLYAGLLGLSEPNEPLGRLWRACDVIREHRGDSHVNAWRAAGLDGAEINVLTELWRGKQLGSEASVVNGWTEAEVLAALDRLTDAGLADDGGLTSEGSRFRQEIELATGRQQQRLLSAVEDDLDELFGLLAPWVRQLREALKPPYWWHLAATQAEADVR
jgi:hypothetical protein